jgi:hypothetical protein
MAATGGHRYVCNCEKHVSTAIINDLGLGIRVYSTLPAFNRKGRR